MRLAGKQKLGYFPLPLAEPETIRRLLQFPISGFSVPDPCIGAFLAIAGDLQTIRYGFELDAYRVEQAREVANQVIHGDALDVHCPVESLSLLYLNPPYDFEGGQSQSRRREQMFLEHCYRWLKPAGVLVPVVPGDRLAVAGVFSPSTCCTVIWRPQFIEPCTIGPSKAVGRKCVGCLHPDKLVPTLPERRVAPGHCVWRRQPVSRSRKVLCSMTATKPCPLERHFGRRLFRHCGPDFSPRVDVP